MKIPNVCLNPVKVSLLHRGVPFPPFSAAQRHYSTPQFKKSGNLLVNALNYVKDVDAFQEKIASETPEQLLATRLVDSIAQLPELLSLLLLFHHELAQLGVTPDKPRDVSGIANLKFKAACLWKLNRIHDVFWEQCRLANISERSHKLKFLADDVGVLDPKHYREHYQELQSGTFRGTDFRYVEILGRTRF